MAIFKDKDLSHSDRSAWDRKRHRQLVEDSIKKNLGDIIAEESIIGQSKDKKIKIPIRGIKEYQFIYGTNTGGTGSGSGAEEKGQVIGKNSSPDESGSGQASSGSGEEIYETEITLEELIDYLFEDLQLPDMERKKFFQIELEYKFKRSGFQLKGTQPRLNKKRTTIEKLKRKQMIQRDQENQEVEETPKRIPFHENDLRYSRLKEELHKQSNAIILCIMDTSGSMDQTKKYLARSFYFLLYQFIRWKYEHVEVAFIAHTTVAQEVNEEDFFHRGEAGGTYISSGYAKALEIIDQRYNPTVWNIYTFHCSDGDNWSEDNDKAVCLLEQLCAISNLFGYAEINTNRMYGSSMAKQYDKFLSLDNFVMVTMNSKEDIWAAFKKFLNRDVAPGGNS